MKQIALRAVTVVLCLAIANSSGHAEAPHDTVAKHGVVVSVESHASEVGLDVLKRGGSAVDAAVATALALAVTHPQAGNIGGGGFMMVHVAKTGETECVEYRETAPAASTREILSSLHDTSRGHLSVGVPGTVRGLALAHQKFGSRPWRELVEPAVRLADGFAIDAHLARSLNGWLRAAKDYDEAQRVFRKPDGSAWQAEDQLAQPDLARTLRLIAENGPDAFYTGAIADQIVAEIKAGGGLITKDDLAAYRANVRRPIHGTYRGHDVFAPPPPSSGGIALVEMLNFLENFDLAKHGRDAACTVHQFTESMRRAYFDRAVHVGDPAFTTVPIERLTSKAYAREMSASISARDRATPSDELGKDLLAAGDGENTTHFSIVDSAGNAVANTYTLQDSYGSYVVVRRAGFLLNNEMTDFNLQPGVTDRRGRIGTPPNLVAPHKRMLSSQTPTIVLRGSRVLLVTGSPGGRTIPNTVLGVVTNLIDFHMPVRAAVDAPRMHHQWMPDLLRVEPNRVSDETRQQLESIGHKLDTTGRQGDAHSIWIDPATGLRHGAADKRLSGKASGF